MAPVLSFTFQLDNRLLSSLNVSIVETEEEFRRLNEAWNRLAAASWNSLFLQHEWFDAAWAWRKQNASLFIFLVRDAGVLVGIIPLVRVRENARFLPLRSLEFLVVPDTQLCDLIAAPADRHRVSDAFCAELHRKRNEWDRLALRFLDVAGAALSNLTDALDARGFACEVATQDRNLYIALDSSWDSYYGARSRSLKKANNLAANRLKKRGEIAVESLTSQNATEATIERVLAHVIDISRRSWKQDTGNSLDQPGPAGFIRTLTAHAARRGWLSVWLLTLDGKPLAMEYQLLDAGNVYALRADFDAECEEISPGSHLMRTLLESLFGKNLQRYYMGPGENPYKTRWTEEGDALYELVVYGRTWRGHLVRFWERQLKPLVRRARAAFAPGKTPA